jgi:hypothetical protein
MPEPSEPVKRWNIDRWLGVINVILVIVVAALTVIGWFPKWGMDKLAYAAHLQTPTLPSSDLSVGDFGDLGDGTHCYDVNYSVNTKNQSDRSTKITYAIAELFVGDLHVDPLRGDQAYEINGPPSPWDPSGYGRISWRPVAYDASLIDGDVPEAVTRFFAAHHFKNLSPGGGMTGIVAPGDSTGENPHFVLRARPQEYVGAVVAYGIDDATTSPSSKINLTSDVKHLADLKSGAKTTAARDHCGTAPS